MMYRHGLLVRIAQWVSVHVEKRHAERQDQPSVGAPMVDRLVVIESREQAEP
jgi:hypothetical protein